MTFPYDHGDEWRFRTEVIATGQPQPNASTRKFSARIGKAPRQYPDIDDA